MERTIWLISFFVLILLTSCRLSKVQIKKEQQKIAKGVGVIISYGVGAKLLANKMNTK